MKEITVSNIADCAKLESGLYSAVVDGKDAVIGVDAGNGFTIRTESKPGWWQIVEYDENGDNCGVSYEHQ